MTLFSNADIRNPIFDTAIYLAQSYQNFAGLKKWIIDLIKTAIKYSDMTKFNKVSGKFTFGTLKITN